MTGVFEFIISKITESANFMLSLTFDLYGFKVSLFSIEIALFVAFVLIKFIKLGFDDTVSNISHKNRENVKDKEESKKDDKEGRRSKGSGS